MTARRVSTVLCVAPNDETASAFEGARRFIDCTQSGVEDDTRNIYPVSASSDLTRMGIQFSSLFTYTDQPAGRQSLEL